MKNLPVLVIETVADRMTPSNGRCWVNRTIRIEPDLARLDADRAMLVVRRVGGARPPSRFEHREATRPGEELRERRVEVQFRVREREAVRLGEEREQGLVGGGCHRFPSRSDPRLRLLADRDAVLEQLVVDEPGAADRLDEELGLCRRRVEPVCVAFQHVRPSSLPKIVMCSPHPIPVEWEGEFSPTFVKTNITN